jgi:hypothetical protein
MLIEILRDSFTETTAAGRLLINGEFICFTLEDVPRAYGIKVAGKTALPSGRYTVTITPSVRFKRPMCLVYTNPKDLSCELGGIRFEGIRIHGGNTSDNTEGCILVGRVRDSADRIHSSEEQLVFGRVKRAIDSGDVVYLDIRNITDRRGA